MSDIINQNEGTDRTDEVSTSSTNLSAVSTNVEIVCDDPIDENKNENPALQKERIIYEVVFFARYNNGRPSVEEITNFFSNYGVVHHVNCPEGRNNAFIFMSSLSTTTEHRRTRTTISQIINDMTPENRFHITVASSNRPVQQRQIHYYGNRGFQGRVKNHGEVHRSDNENWRQNSRYGSNNENWRQNSEHGSVRGSDNNNWRQNLRHSSDPGSNSGLNNENWRQNSGRGSNRGLISGQNRGSSSGQNRGPIFVSNQGSNYEQNNSPGYNQSGRGFRHPTNTNGPQDRSQRFDQTQTSVGNTNNGIRRNNWRAPQQTSYTQ
jgi:hypothetical protein